MKQSLAKELFEAWWSVNGYNSNKEIAWQAFKKGIKVAEAYTKDAK